jgi:murein DD-endopeptidase MepM/ murein hydrolase activator NlpD
LLFDVETKNEENSMGKYELIEYRPNRWIKIDPQAGVVGPATPEEVAVWQSAQEEMAAASDPADEDAPSKASEGDSHGAPQKPEPKPRPVEPSQPDGRGSVRPLTIPCRVTSTFTGHRNRTPPSTAPGIDLACKEGTEVRAWAAGRVIRSRWSDAGGRSLWILHDDGFRTYYAHLSSVSVLEGETVVAGQKIAESGDTGHTTGPHLHFSVVRNGQYVDPAGYLPAEEHGIA